MTGGVIGMDMLAQDVHHATEDEGLVVRLREYLDGQCFELTLDVLARPLLDVLDPFGSWLSTKSNLS
eukprot:6119989-Amphidinium_carterae.1